MGFTDEEVDDDCTGESAACEDVAVAVVDSGGYVGCDLGVC
jgi:hypothetical protein